MNIKLIFEYETPNKDKVQFETNWFDDQILEYILNDFSKINRIKAITILDDMGMEWSLKEFRKLKQKVEAEARNPIIYFDGGYHKESGEAGIGIVIYYEIGADQFRLRYNDKIDGLASSNEAEYAALFNAVNMLEQLDIRHTPCTIKGDGQGVLKQLAGEWPCYEQELCRWLDKIEMTLNKLHIKPTIEVISRAQNKEADKLARQALENKFIHSHTKLE
ncbi:hypothetical protein BLX87_18785 [Bacillus sp. VT-16-64]|nr:hypothetical protein BLX87_18785 [Bacillus sp. VT-16-64]